MTTASTTARRVFTVAGTFALLLACTATSALADTPVGDDWPAAEGRSFLANLLIFGGGTVVLFIATALLGLMTARNNYVPPPPSQELATTPGSDAAHH